jgi:tRNA A37 threonylcarbamoyltransferase TsaD
MTTLEKPTTGDLDFSRLVYFRNINELELAELPADALRGVDDLEELVVVTNGDGLKLAIIEGLEAAEAAAQAYKLEAVSVH